MEYVLVNSDELLHYGVKGMRWGVHKAVRGEKRAMRSAMKAATSEERNKAFSDANKFREEADRLRKAHADAKAQKKHMRLNKDGTITEISKDERVAHGKKVASGIAKGTLATVGVAAAAAAAVAVAPAVQLSWGFLGAVLDRS